jgi:hypothetical protein
MCDLTSSYEFASPVQGSRPAQPRRRSDVSLRAQLDFRRHARHESRGQDHRAFSSSLLAARISHGSVSTRRATPADYVLPGADASKRPFAHSQRLSVAGPPLRGQCSWPASSALPPFRFRSPVRFRLLRSTLVRCQLRAGSTPKTRYSGSSTAAPASPSLHSPSGACDPFRIKAFSPVNYRKAHLGLRPDFLSLPELKL